MNGETPGCGDGNANQWERGEEKEQRVASANRRKSDTVFQSCSGGSGRELGLAVRREKWS